MHLAALVEPDSYCIMKTKLEFRELVELPMRMDFKDQ